MKLASNNAEVLQKEFIWLGQILDERFKSYFEQKSGADVLSAVPPPMLEDESSPYVQAVKKYEMDAEHRLMLLLAMAPHVAPPLLDIFLTKNKLYNRGFTEFGGLLGQNHSGMMPTGETVIFVLSGGSLERRFNLMPLFAEDHFFFKHNILKRFSEKKEEPKLSDGISISQEYLTRFTTGEAYRPRFSNEFPAKLIETKLEWEDLILDDMPEYHYERLGFVQKTKARLSRLILRTTRYRKNPDGIPVGESHTDGSLSHRSLPDRFQIHWRNRKEFSQHLRSSGTQKLDFVF